VHIVFRVDSSDQIGTGHVMRCLTLAEALRERGANCIFICRNHPKNIYYLIKEKHFLLYLLEILPRIHQPSDNWLGVEQIEDAEQTLGVIKNLTAIPDWLIIDHYEIDIAWESKLREYVKKIMVISDLIDRKHNCDLLLSQNLVHIPEQFHSLVPKNCRILCGYETLLFRPQFVKVRQDYHQPTVPFQRVLVAFSGIDKFNLIKNILEHLAFLPVAYISEVTILLGLTTQSDMDVKKFAERLTQFPWRINVVNSVNNMANLIASHDIAISAAGFTAYELAFLNVPTVLLPVSSVQKEVANFLQSCALVEVLDVKFGIDQLLELWQKLEQKARLNLTRGTGLLRSIDGCGTDKVCEIMWRLAEKL